MLSFGGGVVLKPASQAGDPLLGAAVSQPEPATRYIGTQGWAVPMSSLPTPRKGVPRTLSQRVAARLRSGKSANPPCVPTAGRVCYEGIVDRNEAINCFGSARYAWVTMSLAFLIPRRSVRSVMLRGICQPRT